MRRRDAATGSSVFLALAPGTVAGLIPWWMTRWRFGGGADLLPLRILGGLVLSAGAVFLVHAFIRFVVDGLGTPAPVAPTQRLVVTGVYRHVRNPMYLAVAAVIVGQSMLFGQPWLLLYALVFIVTTATFVRGYEEPTLLRQFPEDYPAYRAAVPGWRPRRHPYEPEVAGRAHR